MTKKNKGILNARNNLQRMVTHENKQKQCFKGVWSMYCVALLNIFDCRLSGGPADPTDNNKTVICTLVEDFKGKYKGIHIGGDIGCDKNIGEFNLYEKIVNKHQKITIK